MKITNKTKVEECAISVRLRKCLKSCDIETIGDLLNKNTFYFAQQSVFGRMTLKHLHLMQIDCTMTYRTCIALSVLQSIDTKHPIRIATGRRRVALKLKSY